MQAVRRFAEVLHPRPAPSGIDIACGLRHFAIITYAIVKLISGRAKDVSPIMWALAIVFAAKELFL